MEAYRDEDEQLAALKQWWKQNGNSLLIGIGLALAIVFGWKAYEKNTQESAEAASNRYQALLQTVAELNGSTDEAALAKAQVDAHGIKQDHAGSPYAQFAALVLAKLAVQQGNLAQAEEELRWVLAEQPSADTERLAKSRLARVLAGQQKYDDAVALLDVPATDAFYLYYQELKGDILLQAGQTDTARDAYKAAVDKAREVGGAVPLLEAKLADLAVVSE